MKEENRKLGCPTKDCRGVHYIENEKYIICTDCDFKTEAKRITDIHLMSFKQLQREFNEN